MTETETVECDHPGCTCKVAIEGDPGGPHYCSAGCADGRGCEHPECECHAPAVVGADRIRFNGSRP